MHDLQLTAKLPERPHGPGRPGSHRHVEVLGAVVAGMGRPHQSRFW